MVRFLIIITVILFSSCSGDTNKTEVINGGTELVEASESEKSLAFKEVNALLKEGINDPTLYLRRSKLYLKYGDLSSAVNDLDRAIGIDSVVPEFYLLKAELLKNQDKLKESKAVLEQCMHLDNGNLKARIELGWLALISRNYKQALDYADAVLRKDVYNAEAYFLKGMIFEDKGDTARAISSYITAIEQENDYYEAYMQVGLLSFDNDQKLGKEFIKNALRIDSNSMEALYAYGMVCQESGDYNVAIETYYKILSIEEYREPYFNLGYIHQVYLKVFDVAVDHYTNAIRIEPKYIDAYLNRALCYEQLDEPQKAIADLKIALKLNPQYTEAATLMGRILKDNGL